MKIYKYPIDKQPNEYGDLDIDMPFEAEILTVQTQNELGGFFGNTFPLDSTTACIWARIPNPDAGMIVRHFRIIATGKEVEERPDEELKYIGTFQQPPFVWHLFERIAK